MSKNLPSPLTAVHLFLSSPSYENERKPLSSPKEVYKIILVLQNTFDFSTSPKRKNLFRETLNSLARDKAEYSIESLACFFDLAIHAADESSPYSMISSISDLLDYTDTNGFTSGNVNGIAHWQLFFAEILCWFEANSLGYLPSSE